MSGPTQAGNTTDSASGVPGDYTRQTANGDTWLIQKGQLNKLRLRPQIINEHAESSRNIQGVVESGNIVGQIFKASHDNINGINLTLESAAGIDFDDFESYADDAALQAAWVASDGTNLAVLETAIVHGGSQSMELPANTTGTVGDEWARTFPTVDFTGYTGQFWMYATLGYSNVQIRVFVEDASANKSSTEIITIAPGAWFHYVIPVAILTADGGTPADLTDIVKIGFRVEGFKPAGFVYFDDLVSVPGPGTVDVKLWDMGSTLPGSVSLDSGTQYAKLGDLGISGLQAASVNIDLVGGKRMYQLNNFVAGVALEIPANELLITNNYYAITIHYVDTDVSVYGTNEVWDNYYKNGYAFTVPDESTNITAIGSQKDIQFVIFSTQDVYINEFSQFINADPNGDSLTTVYIEDKNMLRTDVLISGIQSLQTVVKEIGRPFLMEKGGKFEEEYSDDFTDDVSSINVVIQYYFIPQVANG